ncbi:MAG: hypothetical protein ACRDHW_17670 [Ktedonobacteraceae bacterium]
MLHRDIVSEHECDGELIEQSETKFLRTVACSVCGTEFTYTPDCDWVTTVLPGMKSKV